MLYVEMNQYLFIGSIRPGWAKMGPGWGWGGRGGMIVTLWIFQMTYFYINTWKVPMSTKHLTFWVVCLCHKSRLSNTLELSFNLIVNTLRLYNVNSSVFTAEVQTYHVICFGKFSAGLSLNKAKPIVKLWPTLALLHR